jgi:hypothetical protein
MKLTTAAAVIRFSGELEEGSARFYDALMQTYPECRELCAPFIEQNKKFSSDIQRAYYGVISDALEGCFAYEGIDSDDYAIPDSLSDAGGLTGALDAAAAMEGQIIRFYQASYEVSKSLIADVAIVFRKTARKRAERIDRIRSFNGS